jgi:lipopolysaccharide export system protein LptA
MTARLATALLLAVFIATPAVAQKSSAASGPPNAMQGFSRNKGQPVHIEAGRLEVRDKEHVATFIGNVQVSQGDTNMRCKTLVVFYEGGATGTDPKPEKKPQAPTTTIGPAGDQRIKKLEARGDVVVTQNDQVATGELATFDMASNMVTMSGNVVLTQGQNVLRGERLVVDMTTGFSRIESAAGKDGRVQGLFLPSSGQRPGAPSPGMPPASQPGSN